MKMSAARRLVSRGRQQEETAAAAPNRQRRQEPEDEEPTPLPPYQPPTCPLSAAAQKAIDDIRVHHDTSKYKRHMTNAILAITTAAADNSERLTRPRALVKKHAEWREKNPDTEEPEHYIEDDNYAEGLEKKVSDLTSKAEKALRELIDYGDELAMHDSIMREVHENLATATIARPAPRRGANDEGENGLPQDEIAPAADENILSAVELLREAKEKHATNYASKSLRDRYGDHNDYKNFKRTVHDALHPGENQPPVPHASTWFPEENTNESAGARRRRNATTDNTENEDDEDEIEMTGVTFNPKCPLSLRIMKEPYSNHVCSHTFEKSVFLEYFNTNATVFAPPSQPRNRGQPPQGVKQVKCPQIGCEKWFQLKDFYDDALALRKIQRLEKAEAQAADEDEDDEEDSRPRGTQRNRPTQIDDDDSDSINVDEDEHRKIITRVKRERQQSHVRAASSEPDVEEVDAMDTD